jgi:hypothetical protein
MPLHISCFIDKIAKLYNTAKRHNIVEQYRHTAEQEGVTSKRNELTQGRKTERQIITTTEERQEFPFKIRILNT